MKILLVEPHKEWRDFLVFLLAKEGHTVVEATNHHEALEQWRQDRPHLVLAEVFLPDGTGLALCETIRGEDATSPVILTASDDSEEALIAALDAGADDYLIKPFSPRLFLGRLRAWQRRISLTPEPARGGRLQLGKFTLDPQQLEVSREGQKVRLSPLPFQILYTLALYRGVVLSPQRLVELVWGYGEKGDTYLLRSHIHHLRQMIEPKPEEPRYLITVRGVGYSFQPEG